MEVDVCLPSISLPHSCYLQDICTVIHNHRASKVLIYFHPKYTLDEKGRLELYGDLHKVALLGGDCIISWGKGTGKKEIWISNVSVLLYTMVTKLTEILGPF
jgi:hypothetical protein